MLLLIASASTLACALAASVPRGHSQSVWQASNFNSLITFGDSYTDENRLNYFASHNGSAPPPGTYLPEAFVTASGGKTWPRFAVQYAGSNSDTNWDPKLTLYNYAVSGAVCSNDITPRIFPTINANFPSVLEYELPAFLADIPTTRNGTSTPYFTPSLTATSAVYALWIGTNDLGVNAFLTNSQVPGTSLSTYLACIFTVLDGLYAAGARVFVLMNPAPLELAPLYANETLHGVNSSAAYWPDKDGWNATYTAEVMREYVGLLVDEYSYRTAFEVVVAKRYEGASVAVFDVNGLMRDVYANPGRYLNGTGGNDVQGYEKHCVLGEDGKQECVPEEGGVGKDGFMWYDELHPSEQTDRVVAKEFLGVLNGDSGWAKYW